MVLHRWGSWKLDQQWRCWVLVDRLWGDGYGQGPTRPETSARRVPKNERRGQALTQQECIFRCPKQHHKHVHRARPILKAEKSRCQARIRTRRVRGRIWSQHSDQWQPKIVIQTARGGLATLQRRLYPQTLRKPHPINRRRRGILRAALFHCRKY